MDDQRVVWYVVGGIILLSAPVAVIAAVTGVLSALIEAVCGVAG